MIIISAIVMAVGLTGGHLLRSKSSKLARSRSIADALSKEAQAGFERTSAALKADHFEVKSSIDFGADCAKYSEGGMRDYFLSHPCERMARAYIQIGDINRNLILVAISWVGMTSVTSAREYMQLIDADAGNIIELSRETGAFKDITYEDRIYMFGIKGTFVWQVEVKPVYSTTADSVVNDIIMKSRQQ